MKRLFVSATLLALALPAQPLDELLACGLVFLHEAQQFLAQRLVGRLRAGLVSARRLAVTQEKKNKQQGGERWFHKGP